MSEQPASGVEGHFLFDPASGEYFFRVYDKTTDKGYMDYTLAAEDIPVVIGRSTLSLYSNGDESKLGWSSEYLKRKQS